MNKSVKNDNVLLFTTNKFHQNLTFLIIVVNLIATLVPIEEMSYTSRLFTFVMYNIIATLFYFLAATQVKVFNKTGSITLVILGALQLLRCIFIPEIDSYVFTLILLLTSGVVSIYIGIHSYFITKRREVAKEERVS